MGNRTMGRGLEAAVRAPSTYVIVFLIGLILASFSGDASICRCPSPRHSELLGYFQKWQRESASMYIICSHYRECH